MALAKHRKVPIAAGPGDSLGSVRAEVQDVLALGQLPPATAEDAPWPGWEAALRRLDAPATDDEAEALLDVLPADEGSAFGGLAWTVLHFIETASGWPLREALDDRSWWVRFMRERVERDRG